MPPNIAKTLVDCGIGSSVLRACRPHGRGPSGSEKRMIYTTPGTRLEHAAIARFHRSFPNAPLRHENTSEVMLIKSP